MYRRPMLMKRIALTLTAVIGILSLWANPVWAHNSLVEASPTKEATLTRPPAEVRLRFLASLQPDTKLTVVDAEGTNAIGEVTIDRKVISAPFVATASGVYTVGYELTASDGHVTNKSYTFTLAVKQEPAVMVTETVTAVQVAATPVPGKESTPWWPYIGGAALAGLIVGGIITFLRNRRQHT